MVELYNISESMAQERDFIDDKIVEFNTRKVPFTQKEPFVSINYVTKDKEGNIIAGINALLYCWKILYLDILWVANAYRGKGLGSLLVQRAENEAKKQGCTLIHLDTFDWQAKDFYIKVGFEIFGILEDCPPGHKRYYLKKNI